MVNFSKNINNNNLQIKNGIIYGRFGFSITQNSLNSFLLSFYNYLMNDGFGSINLGYDGFSASTTITLEIILQKLKSLGVKCNLQIDPCTYPQFSWFCSETKKKILGLYVCTSGISDYIEIRVLNNSGKVIKPKELNKIIKTTKKLIVSTIEGYELEDEQTFTLEGYAKWLLDKKLISHTDAYLNVDTMFGASCGILNVLKTKHNFNLNLFNLQSDLPRIKNYISKPTGSFLRWYSTSNLVSKHHTLFGIDGTGSFLGVYDVKQNLEVSPSGISILLLKYLKEVKKIENAFILLSEPLSNKVVKYLKDLKYSYMYATDPQDIIEIQKFNNGNVDLYCTENGGYHFKGDVLGISNPIIAMMQITELCYIYKKSPGELLDEIQNQFKKIYYHASFSILKDLFTHEELILNIENSFSVKKIKTNKSYTTITITSKFKTRIVIKLDDDLLYNFYIESTSDEELKGLVNKFLELHTL